MGYKIKQVDGEWFIFPLNQLQTMSRFIRDFTDSKTVLEAHEKIEELVGYGVNHVYFSPPLRNKDDAEKVAKYFTEFNLLFE